MWNNKNVLLLVGMLPDLSANVRVWEKIMALAALMVNGM
jgi:hypothetical protein